MYVYMGKFDHVDGYAKNELCTIVFPTTIESCNDAILTCQWTVTAKGVKNANADSTGKITRADMQASGEIKIDMFKGDSAIYYWHVHRSCYNP